ncbi:Uncharacterised protein [Streptococcus massiliensis]|uniref:Uncharacterized protein n=1 Tax=Streptococcus massiliensis TaxID=313439 RepID=A0A380KYN9_9STRE|nr:Uncharacterised protein [Streptococcus massiliensis]
MKKAKIFFTTIFLLIFNIFGLLAFAYLFLRRKTSKRKKK